VKLVRSRDNPQVKALIGLASSSRERRRSGMTVIEGEHLVQAFRDDGGVAETIFAAESALARPEVRKLVESTPAGSRILLADSLMGQISQLISAAGVAAVIRTPESPPLPDELGTCVLLENIQDPGNLGSILRSAAAAGIAHVLLSRGSVFAWAPKVVRAGMGAHFGLSIFEDVDFETALNGYRGRVIATDPREATPLYALDLRGPVAWLFGNEGGGLTQAVRRLASDRVRIPMPGETESLNLAASAAICLFEQVRQRSTR